MPSHPKGFAFQDDRLPVFSHLLGNLADGGIDFHLKSELKQQEKKDEDEPGVIQIREELNEQYEHNKKSREKEVSLAFNMSLSRFQLINLK